MKVESINIHQEGSDSAKVLTLIQEKIKVRSIC